MSADAMPDHLEPVDELDLATDHFETIYNKFLLSVHESRLNANQIDLLLRWIHCFAAIELEDPLELRKGPDWPPT